MTTDRPRPAPTGPEGASHEQVQLDHKHLLAAAAGTTVLGLASITSIVNGHDLSLFNLVAPVTNAAWLSGAIILAVSLKRGGTVSTAVAAGLPITWVAVIPLATIGDGVIAGAYYLIIGYLLINNMIEPGAARPVGEGCGAEYPGSDVRRQKVDDGRPAGSGGAPSGAAV